MDCSVTLRAGSSGIKRRTQLDEASGHVINRNKAIIAPKCIDGVAIDRKKKQLFLIELKSISDATEDYRQQTERVKVQYASITPGLQQAAMQNGLCAWPLSGR